MPFELLKSKMKKLIVASTNPVKIESAQMGFAQMFPDENFEVQGVSASSEVSEQPMSSDSFSCSGSRP